MKPEFWRKVLWRVWEIIGAVNIRFKIMGIVIGGTMLLSVTLAVQMRYSVARTMETQVENRGVSISRDLSARSTDLILVNDLYALRQLLLETRVNNPDVVYAFVLDSGGNVLAATFDGGFPVGLREMNTVAAAEHHHTVLINTGQGLVWDIAVPVLDGRAGTARIGLSYNIVEQTVLNLTAQMLLTTIFILALSLLAAVFLVFVLTRPILELVSATRAVAKGDFSPHVRRWADDELGELADAFNAMAVELARTDEIRREREQLRRQLLEKVIATQEDERRRIARELHDSTSQNLTSLMVGLKNIETICNDPHLRPTVAELRNVTAQTLNDVHEISTRLRPRILDDLGLAAALERLTHEWQARHKIIVDLLIYIGEERLPGDVETAIYRIVQEALTNIARYAGARSVSVLVERRGGDVLAVVEDDGQGFDSVQNIGDRHLGLVGMRERAELLDGKLTIESEPGKGTGIHVQIPLRPEPNDSNRQSDPAQAATSAH